MNTAFSTTAKLLALLVLIVIGPATANGDDQSRSAATPVLREAQTLIEQGKHNLAIAVLDAAIKRDGRRGDLLLAKGCVKQLANLHESALEDFSGAIELNFKLSSAYASRGTSHFALGDHKRAINDLNLAVQANPESATAYVLRGRFHFLKEEFRLALDDYNSAIRHDPDARTYIARAFCHFEMNNYDEAASDATAAIALDPDEPNPLYIRASANKHLGKYDAALSDYRLAQQLEAKLKQAVTRK